MKKIARFCYGISQTNADLLYLSGFSAPDPFMWLEVGGQQFNIVNSMEYGRACQQSPDGMRVLTVKQAAAMFGLKEQGITYSKLLAGMARMTDTWEWETPGDCPLIMADEILHTKLRTADGTLSGDKIELVPISGAFCPERIVKSQDEAECLRHAEMIAQAGLERAIAILSEAKIENDNVLSWNGAVLTSEILQGEINAEIARNGGSASDTIAAPGVQGANPHLNGSGPVHSCEPIVIDIYPRCCTTGYHGDLTRTVVKGHASDVVKAAFAAVYDAQKSAFAMLKPGVTGAAVHNKAEEVMASHGFKTSMEPGNTYGFIHGLGHGVGLEIHEAPHLNPRNVKPLECGNVVTVEPGLYYPEWGGIRIEDMVILTEDGIDDFTTAPVFLEIE